MSILKRILSVLAKIWIAVTSVIGSLFVLLLIAIIVIGTSGAADAATYPTRTLISGGGEKIAVIPLTGEIVADDFNSDPFSFSTGAISAKRVIPMLDHVMQEDDIKAVVLRINSPGGAVVASDEIYLKVKELNAKKPVIVSFGDVAASGGYYIAAGASEIVANPATITGSIGVIAQLPQYSELLSKVGVQMRTIKSGEFKDLGAGDREMTDGEQQIFQTMIDEAYNQFVTAIVDGRKMDEARVRQLADGRIYTGKQAKENGLINELGTVETAIDRAKSRTSVEDPTVVEFSEKGFLESLLGASTRNMNPLSSLSAAVPHTRSGVFYLMTF